MEKRWRFFEDPCHGWLEVHKDEIVKARVKTKITGCSYINGDYVYLEEDVDVFTFLKAIKYPFEETYYRDDCEMIITDPEMSIVQSYSNYHPKLLK